jgi:hypothetical protein
MASAHPAHCADDYREWAKPRSRLGGLLLLSKLPAISVVVLALGLAGCARDPARGDLNAVHHNPKPAQREVRATPARLPSRVASRVPSRVPWRAPVHTDTRPPVELRVSRPDPALLTAQPAPNCEFNRADIKAVDPDEWARLKAEFERQCYQDAEKTARDRLSQLQASSTCEIEPVPQQRPVR